MVEGPVSMKGSRAAHAHPVCQPLLQQRDGSPAAGVQRHPDRRRHQHAEGFVAAKDRRHRFGRHIPLKEGGEHNAKEKIRTGRPEVSSQIFQKAEQRIGIGVPVARPVESVKVKKRLVPVEPAHQQPCRNPAEKAGEDANRKAVGPSAAL